MLKCRKMRGLIAASLYENLEEDQQGLLNSHLEACPACKAQAEQLRKVARFFQNRGQAENGAPVIDLLPAIRRQLHHDRVWSGRPVGWQLGFLGAMCLAMVGLFSYQVISYKGFFTPASSVTTAREDAVVKFDTPSLRAELEKASLLTHKHNYVAAYKAVQKAIQQYPGDQFLGLAHLQLADLAYTYLQWYPEAYEEYETLVKVDPTLYSNNTKAITRRELLAEAREKNFDPLHSLDAAHRSVEQFAQLEKVVARYPDGFIAGVAAEDMAKIAAEEVSGDEHQHVMAMECARDRCKDAFAIARLNIELGHLYLKEMNNPTKARDVYAAAAKSENPTLAQLAANALAGLK